MIPIKNHKFVGVDFIASPNVSQGIIAPRFIVQHYTAGWDASSAINTFKDPRSKVSAQLVVDRDGRITQMVPFNRKAWHAGPSRYGGFEFLNGHSIGIENVNIGYLLKAGDDKWMHWNRKTMLSTAQLIERGYDPAFFVAAPNPRLGSGTYYWPGYTEAQITANDEIVSSLIAAYPIEDIITHEEIDTRGWKTDPGPAFPMQRYKAMLRKGMRADPQDGGYTQYGYQVKVTTGTLNVRSGPGPEWKAFASMAKGAIHTVKDKKGDWLLLAISGDSEGWVHGYYTERL
jgi:N-acetylmuramoyl-L-alanine amidase